MESSAEALNHSSSDVAADADFSSEIRFGVVMYGGVSLAIYINGVTNELFEMACATPRNGVVLDDADAPCTREIYRRLSWLTGSSALRRQYANHIAAAAPVKSAEVTDEGVDPWTKVDTSAATQTRLVIDVVAGTSAGGINGIFLAKALANGEQFSALKDLWVNEGDIGLLLNDKVSYRQSIDPPLKQGSGAPASLLNSDRMYVKLLSAMQDMAPLRIKSRPSDGCVSPLVDEVDLYVTTTDIMGSEVPLRLFDKTIFERRYKQSYHFSFPNGVSAEGNDFAEVNDAFLAFAARCTSSFPFAFEPMTLAAVTRLKADGPAPGVTRWHAFFPDLPRDEIASNQYVNRAFGDGGYLDNKPFGYVVNALSQRFSSVPIERKLVYIEPSPERVNVKQAPDPQHAPNALENAFAALSTIPRYETIREDLQAVLQRNRRIERVERMVRLGERDIESQREPFGKVISQNGQVPPWASLKLSEMADYYGLAFLPYQRMRVYAVSDSLAERLARRCGIDPDADRYYALRALVRVWRERHYGEEGERRHHESDERRHDKDGELSGVEVGERRHDEEGDRRRHQEVEGGRETVNAFLDQFDVDYRLRRLGFLLRKIDQVTRLFRKRLAGSLDTTAGTSNRPATLSESELQIVARLPQPFTMLGNDLHCDRVVAGLLALCTLQSGLTEVRAALQQTRRQHDIARADVIDSKLHKELQDVLLLVLGEWPVGHPPQVSGSDAEQHVPVVLNPDALKMASASRTLQEGVVFRANALFDAAESVRQTPLHTALINEIESMRFKRSAIRNASAEPIFNQISARAWELLGKPGLAIDKLAGKVVVQVSDAIVRRADDGSRAAALAALNSAEGLALRHFFGEYYLRFDSFDQMSFPLYYDTGTGEPSLVEVVRISPVDATGLINEANDALHRRKLAGTALANFGAFLDRRWRLNDIMWGRLDGAERLIQALLPMMDSDSNTVRSELITRAHRGILREALVPEGQGDLTDLLIKALDDIPANGTMQERLQKLLAQLATGNSVTRERLTGVLASLLSERGLVNYVKHDREIDPQPDPETTLASAARAVTITGRLLEGISQAKDGRSNTSQMKDSQAQIYRWFARLGLLLQGIVAVAIPGALSNRVWTHVVQILYAFEAVAVVAALLFGSPNMRSLSITALGVTLAVHLLTLIVGDMIRERKRWLQVAVVLTLFLIVGLAAFGAAVLLRHGL